MVLVFCLASISIISWKARQRRLGVRIWLSKSRSSCWSTSPPRLIQAAGLSPVKAGGTNVSRSPVISGCRQRQTVPIFPMILSGKLHPTPTPLIRTTEKKNPHTYQTKKPNNNKNQAKTSPRILEASLGADLVFLIVPNCKRLWVPRPNFQILSKLEKGLQ